MPVVLRFDGDHSRGEQPVARGFAVAAAVESQPVLERRACAHGVDAADEAADPFERGRVFEFGGAARLALAHAEAIRVAGNVE